ncbi:hypothetical protein BUALT_Bualt05G0098300 [Buddleja alternifolia]|uniref:Uncharacterized protein n=1 Tax=Buddleja alternifolia TaxID=168488 RepID=A0AAV6XQS7_9LAMI|nr:hypothetical protein BUALT_Bualt05G0098300 [Buddleja alternifolia]
MVVCESSFVSMLQMDSMTYFMVTGIEGPLDTDRLLFYIGLLELREIHVVIMSSDNVLARIDRCLDGEAEDLMPA